MSTFAKRNCLLVFLKLIWSPELYKYESYVQVWANIGPLYKWMHGIIANIDKDIKEPTCTSIKIAVLSKCCYSVGISRWQNICIPILLYGSIPFYIIFVPRVIIHGYEGLPWYAYSNYIYIYILKYPYPLGIRIYEILIIDTWMVYKYLLVQLSLNAHVI